MLADIWSMILNMYNFLQSFTYLYIFLRQETQFTYHNMKESRNFIIEIATFNIITHTNNQPYITP